MHTKTPILTLLVAPCLALAIVACEPPPAEPPASEASISAAGDPSSPFSEAAPVGGAVESAAQGLAVSCRSEAECGGAACVAGVCAACGKHADCASNVCDTYAFSAFGQGRCVPESRVIYVDGTACAGTGSGCSGESFGTGAKGDPLCTIREAVQRASADQNVVRVAPGFYCPVSVAGKQVALFGPGGDGGVADVTEEDVGGASVSDGGSVIFDGFALGRHSTTGVRCSSSGAPTRLTVRRSDVLSDVGTGLSAGASCQVTVDRSRLSGLSGAMALDGAQFKVTNSVVTGVSERTAIRVNGGSGTVAFSTISGNGDPALAFAGAIDCGSTPVAVQDSIVHGNLASAGSQIAGACQLKRVVIGGLDAVASPGAVRKDPIFDESFGLPNNAANADCCINKGGVSLSVLRDFAGNRRPQGGGWDIGAFETAP